MIITLGGKFSLDLLQAWLMIDRSFPSSSGWKQNRRQSIPNLKPHSRNTAFRYCSSARSLGNLPNGHKLFHELVIFQLILYQNVVGSSRPPGGGVALRGSTPNTRTRVGTKSWVQRRAWHQAIQSAVRQLKAENFTQIPLFEEPTQVSSAVKIWGTETRWLRPRWCSFYQWWWDRC